MSANEIGGQAAGQAGGALKKGGSKVASKAVGKAGKYLKKLLMKFLKQLVLSIGKLIVSLIGPWGLVIILAILLTLAALSAIPFADWFLGGNARSEEQQSADVKYEKEFKSAADKTVAELWGIEADKNWLNQVVKTVKPSWGIPASLVRYEIMVNEKKVELSDYKPEELIKSFQPSFSYTTVSDDKERTKSIVACTVTTTDGEGNSSTHTTTEETRSESTRKAHDVLSDITLDYGHMNIKPLKLYYPGGTTTITDQWDLVGTSTSGDCITTTYKQYDHTTVDDRYSPDFQVDGAKFQQILINLGVDKDDMKLFFEFIATADPDWNPALYGGKSSGGYVGEWLPGTAAVPDVVLRYEPLVRKYLELKGLDQLTQLVLALIMQETGGRYLDVMQSSESLGLPPNTLTDPELSIKVGIDHFAAVYASAGGDINLTLQAYNFGGGYIKYAKENGGGYTKENALAFSQMMAKKKGWERYGDPLYVDHVMRYYNATSTVIKVPNEGQIFDVQEVLDVMTKYLGHPYLMGGRDPFGAGIDCSGLIEFAFRQIGVNMSGTARNQYDKTVEIRAEDARPGDFVFWSTYKAGPSHIGMYLGDGKFINSGSTYGVSIDTMHRWRKIPFFGYRRLVEK
ncbi:lysozyme family protein [Paenibacillus taichungensis]|uniref:bifunctional lytic transglycosylase/C40 family peptidase n=1 Tax=Paenibacillus taichungensis TaxID=484184 RepID=UPI0038D15FC4